MVFLNLGKQSRNCWVIHPRPNLVVADCAIKRSNAIAARAFVFSNRWATPVIMVNVKPFASLLFVNPLKDAASGALK